MNVFFTKHSIYFLARKEWGLTRKRKVAKARQLYCYWMSNDLGVSKPEFAIKLHISLPTVSRSVKKSEALTEENGWSLGNFKQK